MNETTRRSRRLSAADWAEAALNAIGEGGLAAVAVEPLAAGLGATKGSFYWHFANRDALIDAALALWEARHTDAIIAWADSVPDPVQRVRRLFATVIDAATSTRIEVGLLATAAHPQVAPVLRRVTERRVEYMVRLFGELGFPPEQARRRGLLAYTTYLGHVQLAYTAPNVLPRGTEAEGAYVNDTLRVLLQPAA